MLLGISPEIICVLFGVGGVSWLRGGDKNKLGVLD